jgi:hypothetical protein
VSAWAPEAGLFYDRLADDEYRRGPGWSSSDIKNALRSPAHAKAMREGGVQTDAMRLGTLRHMLLLEPERFEREFWIRPDGLKFNTKEGIAWKKEHAAEIEGREECDRREWMQAVAWCARIKEHPLWPLFEGAVAERSWYWDDEETGLFCKARTDLFVELEDKCIVADLKSTNDASPDAFARKSFNLGYHVSAAHYIAGVQAVTGKPVAFYLIAAEYQQPFEVNWYKVASARGGMALDAPLRLGMQQRAEGLAVIARCEQEEAWPTCSGGKALDLALPGWATRLIDETTIDPEPF